MVSERLQAHLGKAFMQAKADDQMREDLMQCPPISPQLLRHLAFKFQDPSKSAKPTNPQLAQLLTIQFGCDKVINYLTNQYNAQSEAARKEREI